VGVGNLRTDDVQFGAFEHLGRYCDLVRQKREDRTIKRKLAHLAISVTVATSRSVRSPHHEHHEHH
jgi:hypothetical protein